MDTIPSELLAQIFQILTVADRPLANWHPVIWHESEDLVGSARVRSASEWIREGTPSLGWVNVTFVCRYWRECALRTPSLWTYLSDIARHGGWWLQRFVERAKEAGLCYDDKDVATVRRDRHMLLSEHMHRISTLHLVNAADSEWGFVDRIYEDIFQKSAPMLHDLSLQDFASLNIPSSLPNLRCLRVRNTDLIPWPNQLFTSNLSSFEYHPRAMSGSLEINPMFDALREAPNLRSLTLDLTGIQQIKSTGIPTVTLRSLKHIDIAAEAETVLTVLKHIIFPPTATLRIVSQPEDPSAHAAHEAINIALVDLYVDLTRDSELPAFSVVEVFTKMESLYFAAARDRPPEVSFVKPSYDLVFELPAILNTSNWDCANNIHGLVTKISGRLCKKESLRELRISGAWSQTSISMFYDLWQVEHLDLTGIAVKFLVEYMTGQIKPRSSPGLGNQVKTLALRPGILDHGLCMQLARAIRENRSKRTSTLEVIYLRKADLSLLGGFWEEAGVEIVGA
ncbi:unnamed protein product [Peniophora sp. CBMAI 1063]|nr:unnamed protein product [Peniophora sp. CBMAI 1063]